MKLLGKIPNDCFVACSGGVDSMAAVAFLLQGRKNVSLLFFNHGTKTSADASEFMYDIARRYRIALHTSMIGCDKPDGKSMEEHWRDERYKFFRMFHEKPIIMAHHADDQVENWLFTSMHGNPMLMPYANGNIIRPFLLWEKSQLMDVCIRNNMPWINDQSNSDVRYARNRIRANIVPEVKKINPGIVTVVRKRTMAEYLAKYDSQNHIGELYYDNELE